MAGDVESRLRALEDERAILDTLYAYAHSLDYGVRDEWGDCWSEDAVLEWPHQTYEGREAILDRLILRMAVCELQRDRGTPHAVVINEALELARTFSTEEAVKFINGMLDAIRKKLEKR